MPASPSGRISNPTRKPRKPKRDYKGIEAVWSEVRRAWMWRGRREWRVEGQRVTRVGPLRPAQKLAHEDYLALGDLSAPTPRGLDTLSQAIAVVWQSDLDRGLSEYTVKCMVGGHGVALKRGFGADRELRTIDQDALRAYARKALAEGRNPNTIRSKDWGLLRRCALALGVQTLVDDIAAVRADLKRSSLKPLKPKMEVLRPDEVRELLAAMRRRPILDRQNHHVEIDEETATMDGDILQLLATTGLRVLELSRVSLADVERGELYVRHAKDKSHPRTIDIGEDLAPVIERLQARARAEAGPTTPRAQVQLIAEAKNRVTTACRRWQVILGEPRLNGRLLRHSFVTAILLTGGTLADAMKAAGHSSARTTDRYTHALSLQPAERRRAVAEAFGIGGAAAAAEPPTPPGADRGEPTAAAGADAGRDAPAP